MFSSSGLARKDSERGMKPEEEKAKQRAQSLAPAISNSGMGAYVLRGLSMRALSTYADPAVRGTLPLVFILGQVKLTFINFLNVRLSLSGGETCT